MTMMPPFELLMRTDMLHHEAIFFILPDFFLCAQQCRSHLHACMQLSTYIKGECDPSSGVSTQAEGSTVVRVCYDPELFFPLIYSSQAAICKTGEPAGLQLSPHCTQ